MHTLNNFLETLRTQPERIEFNHTMSIIEQNYHFQETQFSNGELINQAGENSGSCKLFAFAQLHQLTKEQALACFGHYYREDVLQHPDATDHQNIRNFIISGWSGINFTNNALSLKNQ